MCCIIKLISFVPQLNQATSYPNSNWVDNKHFSNYFFSPLTLLLWIFYLIMTWKKILNNITLSWRVLFLLSIFPLLIKIFLSFALKFIIILYFFFLGRANAWNQVPFQKVSLTLTYPENPKSTRTPSNLTLPPFLFITINISSLLWLKPCNWMPTKNPLNLINFLSLKSSTFQNLKKWLGMVSPHVIHSFILAHRSRVWKILLKYTSTNKDNSEHFLSTKRRDYFRMVDSYLDNPNV